MGTTAHYKGRSHLERAGTPHVVERGGTRDGGRPHGLLRAVPHILMFDGEKHMPAVCTGKARAQRPSRERLGLGHSRTSDQLWNPPWRWRALCQLVREVLM